jgi:hypothetical protein
MGPGYTADFGYDFLLDPILHSSVLTFPANSNDLAICLSAYPIAMILLTRLGFGSSGSS